ncbi:uncharacterized protein LOC144241578 [Crocuta crocuta]
MKENSLLRGTPIHCSGPDIPVPSLMAITTLQIIAASPKCPTFFQDASRDLAAVFPVFPPRAGATSPPEPRFPAAAAHCCPRPATAGRATATELGAQAAGTLGGRLRAALGRSQRRFRFRDHSLRRKSAVTSHVMSSPLKDPRGEELPARY